MWGEELVDSLDSEMVLSEAVLVTEPEHQVEPCITSTSPTEHSSNNTLQPSCCHHSRLNFSAWQTLPGFIFNFHSHLCKYQSSQKKSLNYSTSPSWFVAFILHYDSHNENTFPPELSKLFSGARPVSSCQNNLSYIKPKFLWHYNLDNGTACARSCLSKVALCLRFQLIFYLFRKCKIL